ncbi:hypothetical protein GOODEAATRI_022562 [Goodea atripinnis]|uniref:Uncharacterized protein n=1 Tax=Goodea atripinnis TaxID=208336 RepID=A0ABV0P733_9TELE
MVMGTKSLDRVRSRNTVAARIRSARTAADLCNFSGADYESVEGDDRQLGGRRSASLSSDVSGFSCVSLLPTEELDKLVEDVKNLGDEALQVLTF